MLTHKSLYFEFSEASGSFLTSISYVFCYVAWNDFSNQFSIELFLVNLHNLCFVFARRSGNYRLLYY